MGSRSSKKLKDQGVDRLTSFPTVQSRNFIVMKERNITADYSLDRIIGQGTNGVVRLGTNLATGAKVAIKTVKVTKASLRARVMKEFEILRELDHPNIMKVLGLYHNHNKDELIFVTELVEGGSLFDSIL